MLQLAGIILSLACITGAAFANSGDMTYYAPGLGACGVFNNEQDRVAALSYLQYTGSANPCGKTITIAKGGVTTTAMVVDKCMGCSADSIDVAPSVFETLANLEDGRAQVTWEFL